MKNVYKEVTQMVIETLKKGIGPWIRPWKTATTGGHRNAFYGRTYRGINVLLLNIAAWKRGFTSNLWLTYREARKLGGYVSPGEKGTAVIFWKFVEVQEKDHEGKPVYDAETGEPVVRKVPFARAYTVFNVEQCENLRLPETRERVTPADVLLSAERLLSLPRIRWGGQAVYYPERDVIVLPPRRAFRSRDDFYATAFHEITHWTGHPSRLNRDLSGRFGDRAYAMEELVAEMGSAFLGAHVGLDIRKLQHPEYIGSWIRVLEKDTKAIFTAARLAQEACDWLLEQAGMVEASEEKKAA
ncbi:domain of unknown function DUF1738 [Thermodesulfatator indicus DSM 15286]|uniref:Antirestriction protein ArdC n=1 Tax=Thermodesulfatator indicus (strain DSM 15286 / JCM 11887 / CIR29812) TaxID=667014 RepID=F8A9R7_THEID|nr:zincin-like metallopeptidase domain-containing protein [Thermodesulfatator indicus]AEH45817.1 domain of unknown function DUF1738 [Thermodesulfatator indicus DSM 15286]